MARHYVWLCCSRTMRRRCPSQVYGSQPGDQPPHRRAGGAFQSGPRGPRQHCETLMGTVIVPSFPAGPATASVTHAPRLIMMAPK
jgi:hypothetical protein